VPKSTTGPPSHGRTTWPSRLEDGRKADDFTWRKVIVETSNEMKTE
jgi:hypothetical protein